MFDECCFLLRGEFFIRDSPFECNKTEDSCDEKNGQYLKVGNTSTCEVNIDAMVLGRENVYNRANPKSRLLVNGVDISLVIECVSKDNLIQALYANENKEESEEIKERICFSRKNKFIITKYIPEDLIISALDSFGNLVRVLVKDVDYSQDGSKIEILDFDLFDEIIENLELDYSFNQENVLSIDPLSATPKYKDVFFKGFNVSNDNSVEVRFYRVLFSPLKTFDLISRDQFFNLPLDGVVEESNKGFFKLTQQKAGSNESGSIIY